jgi:hypothetical protein
MGATTHDSNKKLLMLEIWDSGEKIVKPHVIETLNIPIMSIMKRKTFVFYLEWKNLSLQYDLQMVEFSHSTKAVIYNTFYHL